MITLGLSELTSTGQRSNKIPSWGLVHGLSPSDTADLFLFQFKKGFFISSKPVEGYPDAISCDVYGLTQFGVVKVLNLLVWGGPGYTSYVCLWVNTVPELAVPELKDWEGMRVETGVGYPLAQDREEVLRRQLDILSCVVSEYT